MKFRYDYDVRNYGGESLKTLRSISALPHPPLDFEVELRCKRELGFEAKPPLPQIAFILRPQFLGLEKRNLCGFNRLR